MKTKICTKKDCVKKGKEQPLSEFYRNPSYRDGYNTQCKACCRLAKRIRYRRRKEGMPEKEQIIEVVESENNRLLRNWR